MSPSLRNPAGKRREWPGARMCGRCSWGGLVCTVDRSTDCFYRSSLFSSSPCNRLEDTQTGKTLLRIKALHLFQSACLIWTADGDGGISHTRHRAATCSPFDLLLKVPCKISSKSWTNFFFFFGIASRCWTSLNKNKTKQKKGKNMPLKKL